MNDFFSKPTCDRCAGLLHVRIMSKFNTDTLCMECKDKEKAHPKYAEAEAADHRAVRMRNYNFRGIGKPSDL